MSYDALEVRDLDIACPRCGAGQFKNCRSGSGRGTRAHAERRAMARRQTAVLQAKASEAKSLVDATTPVGADMPSIEVARDAVRELRFDAAAAIAGSDAERVVLLADALCVVGNVLPAIGGGTMSISIHNVADVASLAAQLLSNGGRWGAPIGN